MDNTIEKLIKSYKKICWYPSAGADFRELLFLSEGYFKWRNVPIALEELPDLFILTDYDPTDICFTRTLGKTCIEKLNGQDYSSMKYLFQSLDRRTLIPLRNKVECIGKIEIPFDSELVISPPSLNYGNVYFMQATVYSEQLGTWNTDILYILTENTGFALNYLIKHHIAIDYIVRVRYGDAFGRSRLPGEWLLKVLRPLNVKYFLSNTIEKYHFRHIPSILLKDNYLEYKDIITDTSEIMLKEIYCVNGATWSNQGDIYWYKVIT